MTALAFLAGIGIGVIGLRVYQILRRRQRKNGTSSADNGPAAS